jgi:hypothetical protein
LLVASGTVESWSLRLAQLNRDESFRLCTLSNIGRDGFIQTRKILRTRVADADSLPDRLFAVSFDRYGYDGISVPGVLWPGA